MLIPYDLKLPLCEVYNVQGDFYLQNLGNLERPVHFLKVLVKDMWKTGFRLSLSQKLKICRHFKVWAKMAEFKKITIASKMV